MSAIPLKIVHVIFSLSSGGAERVVLNLCNEQSKTHEVVLITVLENSEANSFYKSQLSSTVKHISLNSKRGIKLRNFFKFYKLLKEESPNVVHYHLNTVVYGFLPSLFRKIKSVHTLHSVAQLAIGIKGQKMVNKWFYKSKRIVPVALSNECSKSIELVYGIKNTTVILNGVPAAEELTKKADASVIISELRKSSNHVVFVHVARYDKVKNQELLFKVFSEFAEVNEPVSLVVIGRDYPSEVYSNVVFLGEQKNPLTYVSQADAMVLSSFNEGIPMSVLEGFSCGIPVVSTPAGGMKDILSNEKLGMLSKDFSTESFKETLSSMAERIRGNNYPKQEIVSEFERQYSIYSCSQSYINIYTSK